MNLRERIANWLTDGRFALYREQRDYSEAEASSLRRNLAVIRATVSRLDSMYDARMCEINSLETGLREIIAMQTPSANATVRRMASVAKRALDPLKSEAAAVLRVKNGLSTLDDGCGYGCEIIPTTCCGPTCKHNPCSCDDGPVRFAP